MELKVKIRYNRPMWMWMVWVEDEEGNRIGEYRYCKTKEQAEAVKQETEIELKEG